MQSQLVLFNGGLQTKTASHLAQPNQAIECINVDLEKGSIYPVKEWAVSSVDTATGSKPFYFIDTLITYTDEADNRSYAMFGTRLYWSNGTYGAYGLMRWNGSTGVDAVPPTVTTYGAFTLTPTGSNGAMNDTYAYCYTVVDTDGIESVPSHITTVSPVNQDVAINLDPTTVEAVTETVAKRRIYRTGGTNPTFNLIAELDAPTLTYTDSIRDLDVSRIELTSAINSAPPTDLTNLTEANGTFWGSVDDRVYFSKDGQPEYWSPLDFVVLSDTCTGIGRYRDFVVAFTESNTYIISGYRSDNISIEKLPYNEGCLNHNSIANVTEMLVWTSKNGICMFDGNSIQILTRNLLSWSNNTTLGSVTFDSLGGTFDSEIGYNVTYAVGLRGKYYAVYQGGIAVVDLNQGTIVSTISLDGAVSLYYNSQENTLNAIQDDFTVNIYDNTASNAVAQWKTPELAGGEGTSVLKQYRKIQLTDTPDNVIVYVDGVEKLNTDKKKVLYLPSGSIGSTIQLHITTSVEIKSLKIDYGVING